MDVLRATEKKTRHFLKSTEKSLSALAHCFSRIGVCNVVTIIVKFLWSFSKLLSVKNVNRKQMEFQVMTTTMTTTTTLMTTVTAGVTMTMMEKVSAIKMTMTL